MEIKLNRLARGYFENIQNTDPRLAAHCRILAQRLNGVTSRTQAFRLLAEVVSSTRECSALVLQYDFASQELALMSATGALSGAIYRATNATPLLAEVLTKRVPLLIPNIESVRTTSVKERIERTGEFIDNENCRIVMAGKSLAYPRRLIRAALPHTLTAGTALFYAIPTLIKDFPSQGLVIEHRPGSKRIDPKYIRYGESLARLFALETQHLRFE